MEGKEQEAESQDTDVGKTGGDPVPLPSGGVSPPFSSGPEKMVKDSKATPAGRPLSIRIKEEPNDDIKDFAETTMNELLGWYGYTDVIKSQDTAQLSLSTFQPPTASSPRQRAAGRHVDTPEAEAEDEDDNHIHDDNDDPELGAPRPDSAGSARMPRDEENDTGRLSTGSSETPLAAQHRSLVTALSKSLTSKDGGSPCDEAAANCIVCAWCQKVGTKHYTLRTTTGVKAFCSEVCFTQCRRASFKKNKVCDWCKHVRHTVNFVDFQDGELQLQFCSEKCLNQYKMNIFCTETQEHLKQIQSQLHEERKNASLSPGGASSSSSLSSRVLSDAASASSGKKSEDQILITPELWLSQQKPEKLLKTEVLDEREGAEREERRGEREREERDRKRDGAWSERSRSRERHHSAKRRSFLSSPAAAAAAAVVAAYSSNLHAAVRNGPALPPSGTDRAARDRERLRRLIRDSGRDRDSHSRHQSSGSPASSSQFSPPAGGPQASGGVTPPGGIHHPILPPHFNGLGAGLAEFSMINPILFSSLFGPGPAEDGLASHGSRLLRGEREHEGKAGLAAGLRAGSGNRDHGSKNGERALSSTPAGARSVSPANTASSSGTPNHVLHPLHHIPPAAHHHPHTAAAGLGGLPPALHGAAAFPQGMHPPPFMMGVPPFPCHPGFLPTDPAFMGSLLALHSGSASSAVNGGGGSHSSSRHHLDGHPSTSLPSSASAAPPPPPSTAGGCLNAGVPPVTVMIPFPVLLPVPVPIPIPLPIAPEKVQQFFKDWKAASLVGSSDAPAPSLSSSRRPLSREKHAMSSSSPSPSRDCHSRGSHSLPPHPLSNHHHHHHHSYDRRPESASSESSSQSPRLLVTVSGAGGPTPPAGGGNHGEGCSSTSANGCISCASCRTFPRPGRESADSIMALRKSRESADSIRALRRETVRSLMSGEPAVSGSTTSTTTAGASSALALGAGVVSPGGKRSLTPMFLGATLDLSKRARLDENRNNDEDDDEEEEEGAIDLSKDSRSSTPARSLKDFLVLGEGKVSGLHPVMTNGSASGHSSGNSNSSATSVGSGKENQDMVVCDPDMASIDGAPSPGLKVPKIHIIDSRDEPPLAQPLPLPPTDHAYSVRRRSLILDAPSVPRAARSPSPERRYVRTVPRDMVEAAKRRCLRARVRTK